MHPLGIQRVGLQLGVVGGRKTHGTRVADRFNDRHRQGGSFHGIGSRAKLVKKAEGTVINLFHDPHDVDHMGGEGGKRLLNTLLVSDIHQHVIKNADGGFGLGGNMQTRLGHKSEKSNGFQGYRLAAGVGSRDDQRIVFPADLYVDGNHFFLVDERMSCPFELQGPSAGDLGLASVHAVGKLGAGKAERQICNVEVVEAQGFRRRADLGGKGEKDPFDLMLLLGLQNAKLVVCLHHRHGLHENGGSRRGGVMDQTLHLVLALCLDGDDVSAVSHSHQIVLQDLGIRAVDIVLQRLLDAIVGVADLASDLGKLSAGFIGDHVL